MTELEKALTGEAFDRRDPEIREFQSNVKDLCFDRTWLQNYLYQSRT